MCPFLLRANGGRSPTLHAFDHAGDFVGALIDALSCISQTRLSFLKRN
jgi:hypothetical protein